MPVHAEVLTSYSPEVAAGIGRLMPQLDPSFSGDPTPQGWLESTIACDTRDQIVALHTGQVVGAATMNVVGGAGKGVEGWLEDFVVDEDLRGQGVAQTLWQEMIRWCQEQGLPSFSLETEEHRKAAIRFYEKQGAKLVPGTTTHYVVPVPDIEPSKSPEDEIATTA